MFFHCSNLKLQLKTQEQMKAALRASKLKSWVTFASICVTEYEHAHTVGFSGLNAR